MIIAIDNNRKVEGKYIGKGSFSKAYLVQDKVYIINYNDDPSKECLAMFCQGYSKHIPVIEYLGHTNKGKQVFSMPYYKKLTTKHKTAWAQGKEIRQYLVRAPYNPSLKKPWLYHEWILKNLEALNVPIELKEAISTIVENAKNYGDDCLLEANKANLGVDNDGNLILRDILCFESSIKQARNYS